MKVAGLSIEGSYARVSIAARKAGFVKPIRSEDIKLPEDEEQRVNAIREAFLRWKKDYGVSAVVFGLEFKRFTHHTIELPLKKTKDIRKALPFELERHLPLQPEEYVFDFSTVESSNGTTRNLVLAVRSEALGWIEKTLKDTGVSLAGIRCSLIEVINEFLLWGRRDGVILLHHEDGVYYIAGFRNSWPELFRIVKDEKDVPAELERLSVNFGRGIYVSGIKETAPVFERLKTSGFPLSMPAALVMPERKRGLRLDFTPDYLRQKGKDYYPYAIGFLSGFSVLIFFMTPIVSYLKDYAELSSIERKTSYIKKNAFEALELRNAIDSVRLNKEFLQRFQENKNLCTKALTGLSKVLPPDAWLTGFNMDEKGYVEVNGYANRAASIIEPLEKSEFFRNVAFSNPITAKEGFEKFSLRMQLEGGTAPKGGSMTPTTP